MKNIFFVLYSCIYICLCNDIVRLSPGIELYHQYVNNNESIDVDIQAGSIVIEFQ